MSLSQILYRAHQFWNALRARPAPDDLERARKLLSPIEFALFSRLQPGEQVHSLQAADDQS